MVHYKEDSKPRSPRYIHEFQYARSAAIRFHNSANANW